MREFIGVNDPCVNVPPVLIVLPQRCAENNYNIIETVNCNSVFNLLSIFAVLPLWT